MTYSLNEIFSLMLKAARGSGLPMGLAEDCAAAGIWLIGHGQDGAGAVWEGLQSDYIIWQGPSLLDQAIADPAGVVQTTQAVDAPLLLLGMAGVVSGQTGLQIKIAFSNGGMAIVNKAGIVHMNPLKEGAFATITANEQASEQETIQATGLMRVELSPTLFQALSERAALTYVPATEASRQRGAGAGLTDND